MNRLILIALLAAVPLAVANEREQTQRMDEQDARIRQLERKLRTPEEERRHRENVDHFYQMLLEGNDKYGK